MISETLPFIDLRPIGAYEFRNSIFGNPPGCTNLEIFQDPFSCDGLLDFANVKNNFYRRNNKSSVIKNQWRIQGGISDSLPGSIFTFMQ